MQRGAARSGSRVAGGRAVRAGLALLAGSAACAPAMARADAPGPIGFPHPQIVEVLFNVPIGPGGDANKDGTRDAAGDEFVEIANPHDKPINLKGYVLTNRRASVAGDTTAGVRFVFPDMELAPHAMCVVFNGYQSTLPPPVGSAEKGPEGGNTRFNGVAILSMNVQSKGVALANPGDWLLLSAPDGTAIDCVAWGTPTPPPPTKAMRLQAVDADPKGSVQRLTPDGPLEAHQDIDGQPFSPGTIPRRTKPASAGPK